MAESGREAIAMTEEMLNRIARESGVADIVDALSDRLSPTDLQSLLLEVSRRKAARIGPADLLSRFERDRFARPSASGAEAVTAFDQLAWSLLPDGYDALLLSPLTPLGSSSVVGTVDQNKVVSTVRTAEVVADSTNVLALECAVRRRSLLAEVSTRMTPVRLATSQQQVRAQGLGPGQTAHFRLLALCSASRDEGSFGFESGALVEHVAYLAALVARVRPGWHIDVAVTDLAGSPARLERQVLAPLAALLPAATIRLDPGRASGRGYYVDACFKLFAIPDGGQGEALEIGDGGCTTWTRQLLSNHKERLVIAGLGVDRLIGGPAQGR
jgi:hypothetical protein